MPSSKVLVTGATGYLGFRLVERYLNLSDSEIVLPVNACDKGELESKAAALSDRFGSVNARRLCFVPGNLASDEAFAGVEPGSIETIIHCAAVTRFNVEAPVAESVNINGSRRLFQFAEKCDNLSQLAFVSSLYSSGLSEGLVPESPLPPPVGFANHYERSKWESEQALISQFGHLEWRIFRVATIIADDQSGSVTQHNAVHNTLKLFYYGLLSVIPGVSDVPLYFVTGDFAVDAIAAALDSQSTNTIYNVCHGRADAVSLGQFVDTAFDAFKGDSAFARRHVLKPLYSDLESFNLLADATTGFQQGVLRQAVASITPFGPQLFISKHVANQNIVDDMPSYRAPEALSLVERTCAHLVRTKWGRLETVAR